MGFAGRSQSHVAALIRSRRDQIIGRWEDGVRALPHAGDLDEPRLVDHIPELLERIAHMTEEVGHDRKPELAQGTAERHAIARLQEGFDLDEVIGEFCVLRDVLYSVFDDPADGAMQVDELRVLNSAIDRAIRDSVRRYSDVRDRTLQGFDRIAAAALESNGVDDLLRRLLRVLHETTPAIDTSSIYLLDGDTLRMRAAVGMDRDAEDGFSLRIGEGFAGKIAQTGAPMTLHPPVREQLRSPSLARANLRVLHGVPIREGSAIVGVAKIGSLRADHFSLQDQRIFAAMVSRASAAILQHILREQAQQAAQQLAESERQLRALADNIPQLAWMADAGGVPYWFNGRWYEYSGLTPHDTEGDWRPKVHHPEHFARVERLWAEAIASGKAWEDVFPLRGKDGYYRWFLSRAVPIRDTNGKIERWFGTNTDVTARRFLDEATKVLNSSLGYRETLEQLAQLVVPDLADWCIVDLVEGERLQHVAIVHSDHSKLELAREYARNHPPDGERDRGTAEVMRTGQPRIAPEITDEMLAAGAQGPEHLRVLRELGFKSWIGAPLTARGTTMGVLHLVMSDSNRRYSAADVEVAAELGQRAGAAVDNARLYKDAQDAIRVRDDVLAIVSHDLRSPLGAIDLAASMLMQQLGGEVRGRKHIETIRRSTDRMEHLINDLLDLASINVGKFSLRPLPIDAGELFDEVLDLHEPVASERGVKLIRESEVKGVTLLVDRNRVIQALANLLGNAIKFCNPGDVIVVRAKRDRDHLSFVVSDTGPGIQRSDLPHIFEPYWSGRARKKTGTGLGLFIAKSIVEAHGGTIEVESEDGNGATFTVGLPIAPA